jgi:hypothetical protein
MKKSWVYFLLATQFLLAAPRMTAQGTDCKTDRAHFVTRNEASVQNYRGDEYKKHFEKTADSLSQLVSVITAKMLNVRATASEITNYLDCVTRGEDITADMREGLTELSNAPAVLVPNTAEPSQAIVATYPLIGYTTDKVWAIAPSRPIVQCFAKNGSQWSLIGELGGDYSNSTFSIYQLTSPMLGQTWSLLAGRHLGDTGGRLLLEVVVCDGKTFTKKWNRDGIRWGKVDVDGNLVTLSYEKRDEHGGIITDGNKYSPTNTRFTEVLHVTPKGLE